MNPALCENGFLGTAPRLAAAHSCSPHCANGILGQFVLPRCVHRPFPSTQETPAEKQERCPLQQNHSCALVGAGPAQLHTATAGTEGWNGNGAAQVQLLTLLKMQLKTEMGLSLCWKNDRTSKTEMVKTQPKEWRSCKPGCWCWHLHHSLLLDLCCLKETGWIIR